VRSLDQIKKDAPENDLFVL
jgi:hypothetical protein